MIWNYLIIWACTLITGFCVGSIVSNIRWKKKFDVLFADTRKEVNALRKLVGLPAGEE